MNNQPCRLSECKKWEARETLRGHVGSTKIAFKQLDLGIAHVQSATHILGTTSTFTLEKSTHSRHKSNLSNSEKSPVHRFIASSKEPNEKTRNYCTWPLLGTSAHSLCSLNGPKISRPSSAPEKAPIPFTMIFFGISHGDFHSQPKFSKLIGSW